MVNTGKSHDETGKSHPSRPGLLFVKPFLGTILFSALIAFTFNPVYQAIDRRTHRPGLAVLTTIITVMVSFIVPLVLIVAVTLAQANTLVNKFHDGRVQFGTDQIESTIERGTDRINSVITALPGGENFKLDKQKISQAIQNAASEIARGLVNFIKSASGAFVDLISTFILSFFLISAFLRRQTELIRFVKATSPFNENTTGLYLDRAGAMTKAMVKGQLIIATAQGFASALSLWLVGIDYFWFFFMLLSFLSFIPLGAGILTIPVGVVIMLSGNIGAGLFVILYHVLVVSNIDNVLRPRLVPKHVRLDPALILLAVFSGIAIFGAPGVIYGPVIMIVLITTIEMYTAYTRHAAKTPPPAKSKLA